MRPLCGGLQPDLGVLPGAHSGEFLPCTLTFDPALCLLGNTSVLH